MRTPKLAGLTLMLRLVVGVVRERQAVGCSGGSAVACPGSAFFDVKTLVLRRSKLNGAVLWVAVMSNKDITLLILTILVVLFACVCAILESVGAIP